MQYYIIYYFSNSYYIILLIIHKRLIKSEKGGQGHILNWDRTDVLVITEKFERKKFTPPPHNIDFFWGFPVFFKVSMVVGSWKLVYAFLMVLGILRFHQYPWIRKIISPFHHNQEFSFGFPDFFIVLMVVGRWNLICVFLMTLGLWRFGFYQKIRNSTVMSVLGTYKKLSSVLYTHRKRIVSSYSTIKEHGSWELLFGITSMFEDKRVDPI